MISRVINYIKNKSFYFLNARQFGLLASTARIQTLLRLEGKENIYIHKGVIIQKMSWLAAVPLTNAPTCKLTIGKNTIIGHFNHIYATGELTIGEHVLTADKVYIADNQHQYDDVNTPVHLQPIKQFPPMHIGDGTWIGENVCILGVSIGKNCVIGANSVVTKEIPDYCVAVGAPAKVVKQFDLKTKTWRSIK